MTVAAARLNRCGRHADTLWFGTIGFVPLVLVCGRRTARHLLTCHGSSDQSFLDDGPLLIRLAFPDQPER